MIVYPDREIELTIGGGLIEAQIITEAARLPDYGNTMLKRYNLKDLGMHCGGAMKVFYEVMNGQRDAESFYARVCEHLEGRDSFVSAHLASGGDCALQDPTAKMIVHADGQTEYSLGGCLSEEDLIKADAAALFSSRSRAALRTYKLNGKGDRAGRIEVFLEVVNRPLRLLIFGAGHVGSKFAELAAASGVFRVEVVDDRPDYANGDRLPFADRVYLAQPDYRSELPQPDERTFVAIMTRCHQTDKVILEKLLKDDSKLPPYLGMIGSAPKRASIVHLLREEGIALEKLDRVVTPMGLPLGGSDPGEIAISMLAEIIQAKNELEGDLEGGRTRWEESTIRAPLGISGS
jgi:xanthine dehydrogenase accessory factor